jgi:hypothetical protein
MKIVIDDKTIKNSSTNIITGVIFVDFGFYQFPDDIWYDFPLTLIELWLQEILCKKRKFELVFMEGSYSILGKKNKDGTASIECYHDRWPYEKKKIIYANLVQIDLFVRSIRRNLNFLYNKFPEIENKKIATQKIKSLINLIDNKT